MGFQRIIYIRDQGGAALGAGVGNPCGKLVSCWQGVFDVQCGMLEQMLEDSAEANLAAFLIQRWQIQPVRQGVLAFWVGLRPARSIYNMQCSAGWKIC